MNSKMLKRMATVVSILSLFLFAGCAQKMESTGMGETMKPMEDKPMMEQQEKKMDPMDDMKETSSMGKNSDKQMGSMDKMVK